MSETIGAGPPESTRPEEALAGSRPDGVHPSAQPGGEVAAALPRGEPDTGRIDGREQRLEPRVVAYWLVSGAVTAAVSFLLLAGLGYFLAQRFSVGETAVRWATVAIGVLLAAWAIVPPPLAYQRWRFSVDKELLRMSSGIVFLEQKAIPVSRLQHVDLLRGPIERVFGLATLVIWTAGNEGAAFRVPGLGTERAARLRDAILAARGDDVV